MAEDRAGTMLANELTRKRHREAVMDERDRDRHGDRDKHEKHEEVEREKQIPIFVFFRGEHGDHVAINPNLVTAVKSHRRDDPYTCLRLAGEDGDIIVEGEFGEVVRKLRRGGQEEREDEKERRR